MDFTYNWKNNNDVLNDVGKNKKLVVFTPLNENYNTIEFETEVTEQDNILTLSTCSDNNKYRVVLHAKEKID